MAPKRRQRSHYSSFRLLILHLLKWQFQPERRSRSWMVTINRERKAIEEWEDGGRGRRLDPALFHHIYLQARRDAERETSLPLHTFPPTCSYTLDFLRDPDAMPD